VDEDPAAVDVTVTTTTPPALPPPDALHPDNPSPASRAIANQRRGWRAADAGAVTSS
jgi:hypothetical protein